MQGLLRWRRERGFNAAAGFGVRGQAFDFLTMLNKNYKSFFIAAVMIAAVFISGEVGAESNAESFTVQVEDVSNRKYLAAVLSQIEGAQDEILVAMYSMYVRYGEVDNPAMRLVDSLVAAKARGVDVRVFLDRYAAGGRVSKGNDDVYRIFKDSGVEVWFVKPELKLHYKLIVIDGKVVVDGSANWTQKALTENFESAQIFRGEEFAALKKAQVLGLERFVVSGAGQRRELLEKVRIKNSFLEDKRFGPRMVTDGDSYVFDLYLLLLKNFKEKRSAVMSIDQAGIAGQLGIKVETINSKYRQEILRLAMTLKDKYGLIDFARDAKGNITVTILDTDSGKPYVTPISGDFNLPLAYWEYGLDKQLILREKFFYLLSIYEQEIARPKPRWRRSVAKLSEKYFIDEWTLSNAIMGLRRKDLIDVKYSRPETPGDYSSKAPSEYRVNELVATEERERLMAELVKDCGADVVAAAREFAGALDDDNDLTTIKDFCRLIKINGAGLVRRAVDEIKGYEAFNPLKNVRYVAGVIKRMKSEGK